MLRAMAFARYALVLAFLGAFGASKLSSGTGEPIPGLQVAVRQSLFDYGTDVSLKALNDKVISIRVPDVSADVPIAIAGFKLVTVHLEITDVACATFNASASAAGLEIGHGKFMLHAEDVSAEFTFSWRWQIGALQGNGRGSATFLDGAIAAEFGVRDEEGLALDVTSASLLFADIAVHAGAGHALENALAALFHGQIANALQARMSAALRSDVPKVLNAYLADVPQQVQIQGLPFHVAFGYALYTNRYILASAFPVIYTAPTPRGPHAAPVSGQDAAQQLRTAKRRALPPPPADHCKPRGAHTVGEGEAAIAQVAAVLCTHLQEAWRSRTAAAPVATRTQDAMSHGSGVTASSAASGGAGLFAERDSGSQGSTDLASMAGGWGVPDMCPSISNALNISDAEILAGSHMLTGYLNDAVAECVLWALWRHEALAATLRDGDLPEVRLITDLFAVLVPGLQRDYPHRRLELAVAATAPPNATFAPGRGAYLEAAYATEVRVLPEDTADGRGGGVAAGAPPITVARLAARVSLVGDVQFHRTRVSRLGVSYEVVESEYAIDPCMWERTVQYLLAEMQSSWGLQELYDFFVTGEVSSRIRPERVETRWRSWGWFEVSADLAGTL